MVYVEYVCIGGVYIHTVVCIPSLSSKPLFCVYTYVYTHSVYTLHTFYTLTLAALETELH